MKVKQFLKNYGKTNGFSGYEEFAGNESVEGVSVVLHDKNSLEEMFASYAKPIVYLDKFYKIPELFPIMNVDAVIDIHKKNIFGVTASPIGLSDGKTISKFLNMCVDAIGTSKLSVETVKGVLSLLPLKSSRYEVYYITYYVGEYGTYIELKDRKDRYILHLYDADTMGGRGNDMENLMVDCNWDKNLLLKRFCEQKQNHLIYSEYDRQTY